jgi:hypothetical protein
MMLATSLALGALVVPGAFARQATTAPGTHTFLAVLITDKGIAVANSARLPRGVLATFSVKNQSHKLQNFTLLGHKTPTLRPGGKSSFSILLSRRGIFPYRSTLDSARPFRGLFIVY